MSSQASLTREAQADLRDAVRRIAKDNGSAARRLRDAVQAAALMIGARPALGRLRPDLTSDRYRF